MDSTESTPITHDSACTRSSQHKKHPGLCSGDCRGSRGGRRGGRRGSWGRRGRRHGLRGLSLRPGFGDLWVFWAAIRWLLIPHSTAWLLALAKSLRRFGLQLPRTVAELCQWSFASPWSTGFLAFYGHLVDVSSSGLDCSGQWMLKWSHSKPRDIGQPVKRTPGYPIWWLPRNTVSLSFPLQSTANGMVWVWTMNS